MKFESRTYRNYILKSLSDVEMNCIAGALEPAILDSGFRIENANRPIEHVYFLESGLAATEGTVARGRPIQLGIVGREGMTGVSVVLGGHQLPYNCHMRMSGTGFQISSVDLMEAMAACPSFGAKLLNFAQTFLTQVAATVQANGRATLEKRLARGLLMLHDRADEDVLPVTHEFLASLVGAQRPAITIALHKLEGDRMIESKRGLVRVSDRHQLSALTKGFYGTAEKEYARLIGVPLSRHPISP